MLANYECDLHGHTNRSDGNDSPVEYIRHAVHRGVKILAITDHDIVPPEMIELGGGKRQEITAYAKGIGVELLRGIEISCETYIDDVHLVCLGCDWNAPYFKELDEFTINNHHAARRHKRNIKVFLGECRRFSMAKKQQNINFINSHTVSK